jgi:2-amino-4-hydroxy-6-hydroxymethyldihydropteridine diphosphokinase
MARTLLGLGSNLDNRQKLLLEAFKKISQKIGKPLDYSSIYETAPLYYSEQPDFLNMAVSVQTELTPQTVLDNCLQIESQLGRTRPTEQNRARRIDIDVLYYGNRIINEDRIQIPHPKIKERRFVLAPLNEIVPHFIDPQNGNTIRQLYNSCPDNSRVTLYKDRQKLEINLDSA